MYGSKTSDTFRWNHGKTGNIWDEVISTIGKNFMDGFSDKHQSFINHSHKKKSIGNNYGSEMSISGTSIMRNDNTYQLLPIIVQKKYKKMPYH